MTAPRRCEVGARPAAPAAKVAPHGQAASADSGGVPAADSPADQPGGGIASPGHLGIPPSFAGRDAEALLPAPTEPNAFLVPTAEPDGGSARLSAPPAPSEAGAFAAAHHGVVARRMRAPVLQWGLLAGVVGAVGILGIAGALSGWIWPLLFLCGAVVVGLRVGRRPWLVVGMVVVTALLMSAPDSLVAYVGTVWLWLAAHVGAAALVGSARRWLPGGSVVLWHLAFLLPRSERRLWRAEVRSVLHACGDDAEVRRQVVGFLVAVPATVVTSWRTRR